MKTTIYNKLVRDKIPEIILSSGKVAKFEILDTEMYQKKLNEKLQEELDEYIYSELINDGKSVNELADIQELICAILKLKKIDENKFKEICNEKNMKNGKFEKRLCLLEVASEIKSK